MRNTPKRIQVLVNNACITTWYLLPKWNTMPLLHRQVKKQHKGSHGAGKNYLCASKKSCFNKHNCKSGRHTRMQRKISTHWPTSVHRKAHKICQRVRSIDLLDPIIQVKTKSAGEYKIPPPWRLCWMIWAISCWRTLNVEILLELINLCCLLKSQTYITTLYPRNLATLIVFILTFLNIVSLDTFFRIPIRSTMWTHGRKLYNQLRNQGV